MIIVVLYTCSVILYYLLGDSSAVPPWHIALCALVYLHCSRDCEHCPPQCCESSRSLAHWTWGPESWSFPGLREGPAGERIHPVREEREWAGVSEGGRKRERKRERKGGREGGREERREEGREKGREGGKEGRGGWREGDIISTVRTWSKLDLKGSHFSVASPPCHVPRRLRHTLPSAYRLGLNLHIHTCTHTHRIHRGKMVPINMERNHWNSFTVTSWDKKNWKLHGWEISH